MQFEIESSNHIFVLILEIIQSNEWSLASKNYYSQTCSDNEKSVPSDRELILSSKDQYTGRNCLHFVVQINILMCMKGLLNSHPITRSSLLFTDYTKSQVMCESPVRPFRCRLVFPIYARVNNEVLLIFLTSAKSLFKYNSLG